MPHQRYNLWTVDFDTPHEAHIHAIKELLHSRRTPYPKIEVVMTYGYGKALILDGRLQSCQRDEYIYHESLAHPVMLSGPGCERVLIIGGGEGSTLREVLRYPSVKEAVMVDIDRDVVEACREHLADFHRGAFDDPRATVIIDDGRDYVKNTAERFDVVIIDISEPTEGGPAYTLYTVEFYALVKDVLKEGGRVVTQACSSSLNVAETFSVICNTVKRVFGSVHPYHCFIPSFGCTWGFAMWADEASEMTSLDVDERLSERGVSGLAFYDGVTNRSLFCLPKDLRAALSREKRVFADENPPRLFR